MAIRAPIVIVLPRRFNNWSKPKQRLFCQTLVLTLTYLNYVSYHAAKRPLNVMKSVFAPECNAILVTNNMSACYYWQPFDDKRTVKDLFGLLDFAFLLTYAVSMFFTGYIAEHTNIRIFLSAGMLLTGLFTSCIGLAYYFQIHNLVFFFAFFILTGMTQATGLPCVVECVGMWFPKQRWGLIMGAWNTHTFIGNIVGSAIAGAFATNEWALAFIVPGILIAVFGVINFFLLIPDPSHLGIAIEDNDTENGTRDTVENMSRDTMVSKSREMKISRSGGIKDSRSGEIKDSRSRIKESRSRGAKYREMDPGANNMNESDVIGIFRALQIPGVIEYSCCTFFAKLLCHTFLIWLPHCIKMTPIGGNRLDASQAAFLATLFDVGGGLGGIVAGHFADYTKSPAIVNVMMLLTAASSLFVLKFYATKNYTSFIINLILSGMFVYGPHCLITTTVAASLGSNESLQGHSKGIAVVTSIIDATGSLGSAVGPLLAGILASRSHGSSDTVFYILIGCDVMAALLLSRQFVCETKGLCLKGKESKSTDDAEKESLLKGEG